MRNIVNNRSKITHGWTRPDDPKRTKPAKPATPPKKPRRIRITDAKRRKALEGKNKVKGIVVVTDNLDRAIAAYPDYRVVITKARALTLPSGIRVIIARFGSDEDKHLDGYKGDNTAEPLTNGSHSNPIDHAVSTINAPTNGAAACDAAASLIACGTYRPFEPTEETRA